MANSNISSKILDLLTTTPTNFNPDQEEEFVTPSNLPLAPDSEEERDAEVRSSYRTQNAELLGDADERYGGKKGSRKRLRSWSDDGDSPDEKRDSSDGQGESSDEDEDDGEAEGSGQESVENEETAEQDDDSRYEHMKGERVRPDEKGESVRHQLSIWENLVEMRIHLQKCLGAVNKFPQHQTFDHIKKTSPEMVAAKATVAKTSLGGLLEKLLLLQELLLKQHPGTKKLLDKNNKTDSEEEIPSDTEDEAEEEEAPKKKQKPSNGYPEQIAGRHAAFRTYRDATIQKWNEKTSMATAVAKKSGAAPHSILNHIGHVLADRQKLIRRTQIKRSDYEVVGQAEGNDDDGSSCHPEIFDDNDFYYQLLHELIELRSADVTDSVQLGRQWIRLQGMRSKMKRRVDTRTTKGRKIRYAVHSKLVNFMAPVEENGWAEEAKDELFGSLFGKTL